MSKLFKSTLEIDPSSRYISQDDRIRASRTYSKIRKDVKSKQNDHCCYLCKKEGGFCNSHTIPKLFLNNIAQNGKLGYIKDTPHKFDKASGIWYNIDMSNFMQETMFTDALCEAMTSKRSFLKTIDSLIPWEDWISKIQPVYYEGRIGQKPYPIELVLRMYVLQNLYDLSDMGVMTEVIDSRAFSWFCGITSPADVPDGDTVGRFRNLLIKNDIQKLIFENVTSLFEEKGWILKKGTIVDSTIIAAPSSTKNKEHKRDPEAKSTKKGSNYYFGYKAHIGVDKDTGLIHHVKATEASVHDTNGVEDTIYGEEEEIYGDSGYLNVEEHISEEKSDDKRKYFINLRKSMIAKMEPNDQLVAECENACYSSVRSKVEHPFNVVKRLFKFRRTRYRGLLKQQAKFNMIFALANLYLADRKKLSA